MDNLQLSNRRIGSSSFNRVSKKDMEKAPSQILFGPIVGLIYLEKNYKLIVLDHKGASFPVLQWNAFKKQGFSVEKGGFFDINLVIIRYYLLSV